MRRKEKAKEKKEREKANARKRIGREMDDTQGGARLSKKVKWILTLSCVVMALIGILLYFLLSSEDKLERYTTVRINGETVKTFSSDVGGIYPGEKTEYEITLVGADAENLFVTLDFRCREDGELKKFVKVKITSGETSIEKTLAELLTDGEVVSLGKNTTQINIVYSMDAAVGNEAQGTNVAFYIDLAAKRTE